MVADAMSVARRPWWVIGSAAVVLHGGSTHARDVDVIVDPADIAAVIMATGAAPAEAPADPLFRSAWFLRWSDPPVPVEFMAGFSVAIGSAWRPVEPRTRERITVDQAPVFVPARDELRQILASFGRPKDVARALLLS